MKIRIALVTILITALIPTASAAIKVKPAKPTIQALSPMGSGDQFADFTINPTTVAIVGTIENGLGNLITSPTLGGSDGFIYAVDKKGVRLWDLRLGSSEDDIAMAITKDKVGYFWVAGATSKPAELATPDTATATPDTANLNPDGVVLDSLFLPTNSLTRLVIWKIGISGQIAETYFYDSQGLIVPSGLAFDGTKLAISGKFTASDLVTRRFDLELDTQTTFSNFTSSDLTKIKRQEIATIKAGANRLKSFISKSTIIGIPSWRAKKPTPVLVKYTRKGVALSAKSFSGKVRKIQWQSGIGAVVLTEVNAINEIYLISKMA